MRLGLCILSFSLSMASSAAAADDLFRYDSAQPLQIAEKKAEKQGALTLHDITFADASGATITAYLVTPEGPGPFAGVLFVHWLGQPETSNRTQFLKEAKELAAQGVVSLLVDMPWSVGGWFRNRKLEDDYDFSIRQVKNLRRSFDVLLSRKDVDPARIAYVGHDFGASYGAILLSVDSRVRYAVLIAGTPILSDWFLLGAKLEGPERENHVRQLAPLDPVNYVGRAKSVSILFQFAKTDEYVANEKAQMFAGAAPPSRQLQWYDCGHEMNAQAAADRMKWLQQELKVTAR